MAWAFRKRIKVIPGVYINLSKSGISANAGVRGASLTFRSDGVYRNLGVPGTGLYSREKVANYGGSSAGQVSGSESFPEESLEQQAPHYSYLSADPLEVTSEGLKGLQQAVIDANRQREELRADAASIKKSLSLLRFGSLLSKVFLAYFIVPPLRRQIQAGIKARQDALQELQSSIAASAVSLAVEMDGDCRRAHQRCLRAFDARAQCSGIWDITSASEVDQVRSRSAASMSVERVSTRVLRKDLPGITSPDSPMVFLNRNGADIYIYPGFFVMFESPSRLGILDLADLTISYEATQFIETDFVPSDALKVGDAWEKSNKDGSRDKRYKENRQLPVMQYGEITFRSGSGVYEKYLISDAKKAEEFAEALQEFKSLC